MASATGDLASLFPIRRIEGYLPIEDHGLIGDGSAAALVARDGSVSWLCAPRFDSPPLFAGILDARKGGALRIAPVETRASRQWYEPDTGVLQTELRSTTGHIAVRDALTLRAGANLAEDTAAHRGELIRCVRVLDGPVDVVVEVEPWEQWRVEELPRERIFARGGERVRMWSSRRLEGSRTTLRLERGEHFDLVLAWSHPLSRRPTSPADTRLNTTAGAWRRWARRISFAGPGAELVRRSAVTLKLLDHFENGAIVAAPTSSLPESMGGERNWDYRYAWVRDAAFSVYAMRRIGLLDEAWGFLAWVLDSVERQGRISVLYDLDGGHPPQEVEEPDLEGHRRSRPVRWGNAAANQAQHDVFGEILDCAYQWAAGGADIDAALWRSLVQLVDAAAASWRKPDHGIWEVRTSARPFTYSAAMCQVALDRAARLAVRFSLPADVHAWRSLADRIRSELLEEAWDPRQQALTEHLSGGGLDASLLSLPLRRVVSANHPRMAATARAISERLGAGGGLLYRYLPDESPDGLAGGEGAFLLCSFWLVDNLVDQRRLDEATELFNRLCDRANPLGLLPEQVDPSTGGFLGNFPQAFSHVGLISSAVNLARATGEATGPSDRPDRTER